MPEPKIPSELGSALATLERGDLREWLIGAEKQLREHDHCGHAYHAAHLLTFAKWILSVAFPLSERARESGDIGDDELALRRTILYLLRKE